MNTLPEGGLSEAFERGLVFHAFPVCCAEMSLNERRRGSFSTFCCSNVVCMITV